MFVSVSLFRTLDVRLKLRVAIYRFVYSVICYSDRKCKVFT